MTTSTIVYKYGSFVHLPGEVIDCRHTIKRDLNRRFQGTIADITTNLDILALGCTPAEIQTREAAIFAAYTIDNQVFGMYLQDGTLSKVLHDNTGSYLVVPPRVTVLQFPESKGAEYATKRTIHIQIDSKVLSVNDEIVEWHEEFHLYGTVWADYVWQYTNQGPIMYAIWPSTVQTLVQTGSCVGLEGWVTPTLIQPYYPTPVGPTWYEDTRMRTCIEKTPITVKGAGTDVKRFFYPTTWSFTFHTVDGLTGVYPTYAP